MTTKTNKGGSREGISGERQGSDWRVTGDEESQGRVRVPVARAETRIPRPHWPAIRVFLLLAAFALVVRTALYLLTGFMLVSAASSGNASMVRTLLSLGAAVHFKDVGATTILYVVICV